MRPGEGLQESLRRMLLGFVPVYIHLAQVEKVNPNDDFGFLLDVVIRPDGRKLQARPVYVGTGGGIGFFWPIAVDDEVIVLIPEGDPNRAVALIGLTSRPAKPPAVFDNSKPIFVHPDGLELRTVSAAAVEPLLKATNFQSDFKGYMDALTTFMASTTAAVTAAQIATAAGIFNLDPRVTSFLSKVGLGTTFAAKATKSE